MTTNRWTAEEETDARTLAEQLLRGLSTNARETLAQVDHGWRETAEDMVRVAAGRGHVVVREVLGEREGAGWAGRALDGWREYLRALGLRGSASASAAAVPTLRHSPELAMAIGDALVEDTGAALLALSIAVEHAIEVGDPSAEGVAAMRALAAGVRTALTLFKAGC